MTAYLSVTSSKLNSEVVIIDECEYFVSDVTGLHDVDSFISARDCGSGPVHRVEDRFNRGHYLELSGGASTVRDLRFVCINLQSEKWRSWAMQMSYTHLTVEHVQRFLYSMICFQLRLTFKKTNGSLEFIINIELTAMESNSPNRGIYCREHVQ